ncbi:DUF4097 family beta strand repeat-containing protein [Streptomyces sp. NPDC051684]|uniref:DUF4097 family beta strand repeat-containing protein n=1 Tax=Streptomyces sp. NPDC051684 TaxID=3365670 RepID=UPI0037A53DC4
MLALGMAVGLLPLAAACDGGEHAESGGQLTRGHVTRLLVTTDNGLRLRPTDGERVTVDRRVDHHWSRRDGTRVLDLSCAGQCPRMPEVDVPKGTAVTVVGRNAGIDAAGVPGPLNLSTVNGDVTVTGSGRTDATLRLTTRNGSVRATGLRASAVNATTVNGDVTLDCATAPRRVTAATTNGSVDTLLPHDAPAYRVTATTDHGRPTVAVATSGAPEDRVLRLTTVNGDVRAREG